MDSISDVVDIHQYKGTCIFAVCENEKIENMEVLDDDTWVLSFPRSGTYHLISISNESFL